MISTRDCHTCVHNAVPPLWGWLKLAHLHSFLLTCSSGEDCLLLFLPRTQSRSSDVIAERSLLRRYLLYLQYATSSHSSYIRSIPLSVFSSLTYTRIYMSSHTYTLASFQALPVHKRKIKSKRESLVDVINVIGRENLITSGQTNELARLYGYSFHCESFTADRTGLGSTTLHYLTVHVAVF